jgi:hypothetical protein
LTPHGRLHQFGTVDLEGTSLIWRTGGSPMVPNQDYREDEEESPSAKCSRGSLWCERCVAGRCGAIAVLQTEEAPSRSKLPNR